MSIKVHTVLSGLTNPSGLRFNGNDLYISDIGLNNISKYSLTPLSNNELFTKEKVILFPNPANNFIQVPEINKLEKYSIYDYLPPHLANRLGEVGLLTTCFVLCG